MNSKNAIFAASLLLNVILIVGLMWFATYSRRAILYSDAQFAEERIAVMQEVLGELKSGDADAVERAKDILELNIDLDQRIAYKYQTAPQ